MTKTGADTGQIKKLRQLAATNRRAVGLDRAKPCENGHFDCSCTWQEGGPCFDDVLHQLEELGIEDYS